MANGFGSRDNPVDPSGVSGGEGLQIAWQTSWGAMGSSGIQAILDSSQSSVTGPIRPHLHPSHQHPRGGRMGRRTSDGGPYVQGYRQFIEKRSQQQLPLIKSTNNIERSDSAMSSTSSVKMLLMEKQLEKKAYGGLPNSRKEWLLQVRGEDLKTNVL